MSSEDNVPKITMFLVFVIVECILALVTTVCVMRIHKQEHEMKRSNKRKKLVCCNCEAERQNKEDKVKKSPHEINKVCASHSEELEYETNAEGKVRNFKFENNGEVNCAASGNILVRTTLHGKLTANVLDMFFFCVLTLSCIAFCIFCFY